MSVDADESLLRQMQLRARQQILQLDRYQQLIFISTNAVHSGLAWINLYWPQFPQGLNCSAIGKATAAALAEYDLHAAHDALSMNSEALLALPRISTVRRATSTHFSRPGRSRVFSRGVYVRAVQWLITVRFINVRA